jgi:hypothetical protein
MPLHKDPRYCHAHGVTSALQARFHGQVLKCAIGLLMIETIPLKRPSFLRDGSLGNEVAEGCAIGEKDVRRPSLSASKRATPEPMVSIKYLCEVCGAWCRKWIPACSVISTKLPGIEPDAVAGLVCCCADAAETSSRATRLLQLGIIAEPLVSMNETAVLRLDLLSNIGTGLEYCIRTGKRDLDSSSLVG